MQQSAGSFNERSGIEIQPSNYNATFKWSIPHKRHGLEGGVPSTSLEIFSGWQISTTRAYIQYMLVPVPPVHTGNTEWIFVQRLK